jgi:hypothetical protein
MSVALRNGLIIGMLLGLLMAWSKWPAGLEANSMTLARAAGQVFGTTVVVVLIAMLIGRRRK